MAGRRSPGSESDVERHVWDLLTRNFLAPLPDGLAVGVHGGLDAVGANTRFQAFEVIVAAIFARLRPEYEWSVTPNRSDRGLDFIGSNHFLQDETLGISATITVGGQCKKRSGRVREVVGEIAGSLINMAEEINPTFFVVALSARIDPERVERARAAAERQLNRTCHILDRRQIEGLIREHLAAIDDVLRRALEPDEVRDVLEYFASGGQAPPTMEIAIPERVRAGEPFSVIVRARAAVASTSAWRFSWRPNRAERSEAGAVTLLAPLAAHEPGVELVSRDHDPMYSGHALELVTYSVGDVDLGQLILTHDRDGATRPAEWVDLGSVRAIENVRPPFFDPPFVAAQSRLTEVYERVVAGGLESIAVVGSGGSGKSRLCEEFSLSQRRDGTMVVVARHAKTLDDPQRVLADLFIGLADDAASADDPATAITNAVARYDRTLAARAEPAIRSILGTGGATPGSASEATIRAALVLLMVARGRNAPLIVHFQDLHWATADVLQLLERLVLQARRVLSRPDPGAARASHGILCIFEGRIRERQALSEEGWTSEPFEAFLHKLDCESVACRPFTPEEGHEFIRRLFEDRYSGSRRVRGDLLELQRELVDLIDRSAGGNPFHSLEQVRLLKERRIIGQNPATGLVYLIQLVPSTGVLPDTVFDSIRARWEYVKARNPALAMLIWAAALLEDRVSAPLFRQLWSEIAPDVTLADIEGTEFLWTGDGEHREAAFRHENYFRSVRRFTVSPDDRERIVEMYATWFEAEASSDPTERLRWARVLLERRQPDRARAYELLRSALRQARRRGDLPLARRAAAAALDLTWGQDAHTAIPTATFLRRCDDELDLTRGLLGSDRSQAKRRLDRLGDLLDARLASGRARSRRTVTGLHRRRIAADVLRSQILFNDRQPARAAELAGAAVRRTQALRPRDELAEDEAWDALEMEALHSHGVGLALSGEIDAAIRTSAQAVDIARQRPSSLSQHVISTYTAIVVSRDPEQAEAMLRQSLAELPEATPSDIEHEIEINLGMALLLRAHRLPADRHSDAREMLAEAADRLTAVFSHCYPLGQYPDAAASALLRGIVSASRDEGDEVSWFAQAVAAAARGQHMETLWRAHVNLATALYTSGEIIAERVRDHARAALEILDETLAPYPHPDRSPRFALVRAPLAQAVRFLVLANDAAGRAALVRYPALREQFAAPEEGTLRDAGGPHLGHEWLQVGDAHYVLY